MKVFKFPNDKSLILFEKSGSSLMSMLFKSLSDWKGIEIRNNLDLRHGDMTLIVRNPLERFISSFFHTMITKDVVDNQSNTTILMGKFETFLNRYEEKGGEIHDPHVYSQLYTFKSKEIDIRVNPNCTIYHIEDIHIGFANLYSGWIGSGNFQYKMGSSAEFFTEEQFHTNLPIFKRLGLELDKWDMFHIITFYYFQLCNLSSNHHRGTSGDFLQRLKRYRGGELYGRVVKIFYKENYILGYKMDL